MKNAILHTRIMIYFPRQFFLFNRNRYPENGCKRYKEITEKNVPDADTIYRRIKMKGFEEILSEFNEIQAKK